MGREGGAGNPVVAVSARAVAGDGPLKEVRARVVSVCFGPLQMRGWTRRPCLTLVDASDAGRLKKEVPIACNEFLRLGEKVVRSRVAPGDVIACKSRTRYVRCIQGVRRKLQYDVPFPTGMLTSRPTVLEQKPVNPEVVSSTKDLEEGFEEVPEEES